MKSDPVIIGGSFEKYREVISGLMKLGLETKTFDDFSPNESHIVLRHDVDMDVTAALRLAEFERLSGHVATYFVMISSPFYNALSLEVKGELRAIHALGHRIALHFDPFGLDLEACEAGLEKEKKILEDIIGESISWFAPHRPARYGVLFLDCEVALAGMRSAYAPDYFSRCCYLSDSDGTWRRGLPADAFVRSGKRALQLLTHPHMWAWNKRADRNSAIDRSLSRAEDLLRKSAIEHFNGYCG